MKKNVSLFFKTSILLFLFLVTVIDTSSAIAAYVHYYYPSFKRIYFIVPIGVLTVGLSFFHDNRIYFKYDLFFMILTAIILVDVILLLLFTSVENNSLGYIIKLLFLIIILYRLNNLDLINTIFVSFFSYLTLIIIAIGLFDILGYLFANPCIIELSPIDNTGYI